MSNYNYHELREETIKPEHQLLFTTILVSVIHKMLDTGAIILKHAIDVETYCDGSGNDWLKMAMVDRLVEMEILKEVITPSEWPAQSRVFIRGKNMDEIKI